MRFKFKTSLHTELYNFLYELNPNLEINESTVYPESPIDFYYKDLKFGIDFIDFKTNCEQNGKLKKAFYNKYKKLYEDGIQIINILEDEWVNKTDIVKSVIKNKLKLTNNTIYSRKCKIEQVEAKVARQFLKENHIQGYINGKHFVLKNKEDIVAILTFGQSRFNKRYDYEILRFCSKLDTNIPGAFSKLYKHIKELFPGKYITYSDLRYGYGKVYESTGFEYLHTSEPNYYYFTFDNTSQRYSRQKFQKHKLVKVLETFDPNMTEYQNMLANSYDRVWDCGNNVFGSVV